MTSVPTNIDVVPPTQTPADSNRKKSDLILQNVAVVTAWIFFLITLPVSIFFSFVIASEYQRYVVFRLGKLSKGGPRGPGIIFILPCIDTYKIVDLRTVTFDIKPQVLLTLDSVTVSVDAVVYYHVEDPIKAVTNVLRFQHATQLIAATALRNEIGTKTMTELHSQTDEIARDLQIALDRVTKDWGVKVERVEIKDVRLPVELQRAMAAEAGAVREAKAKIISAKSEEEASHALTSASDVLMKSPGALQLRYLQTLHQVSAEKNSTMIVFPIDTLGSLLDRRKDQNLLALGENIQSNFQRNAESIRQPSIPLGENIRPNFQLDEENVRQVSTSDQSVMLGVMS